MIDEVQNGEEEKRLLQDQLVRAQKMEAIGLMAGGVAHDLNNILSGIISVPELLLMRLDEDSPLRPHIQLVMESGERAAAVVSDLLTVGRGVITQKKLIELQDQVVRCVERIQTRDMDSRFPQVTLQCPPGSDALPVYCSLVHLDKMLLNLILNASEEVTANGRVTVTTQRIDLSTPLPGYQDVPAGAYALVSIRDNGPGIRPEDQARIFEPFYTKKVMGRSGTGLGLSIVWNAMLDHRGHIQFDSSSEGTEFRLYFPLSQETAPINEEDGEDAPPLGNGETVLVVDDEEIQRQTACELLTSLGYKTRSVASGEEALEDLHTHPADMILLDMMLGRGLNGLETYQKIIADHPQQAAVIATGFARSKDVEKVIALGAHHCLHKPYRRQDLALSLHRALGNR
jgi:nitrogen-specific signal transduction histidine kinase/CheY-like chemotaxis protein